MQRSSIGALSSSSFVYAYVGYDTGAGTGAIYAVVGTISGTTITFGTPAFVRAGLSPQGVGCCALSSTSALVTYGDAGSIWAGTPLVISGTTITVGSQTTTGTVASGSQCVPLTSTTALCVDDYGNKARVATVSGTSLTWGAETTFGSNANYGCVTSASSTTGVVAKVSSGGGVVATALTISGTTITAGTPTTIDASAGNEPFGICAVTPTSVIFAYLNTAGYLKANGATVSGTTLTVGTPSAAFTAYNANAGNFNSGPIITATSSSQALVVSVDQSTTGYGLGQFLNISGTTVTSSGTSTILAASTRAPTVAFLGSGKAIAGYGQGTTNISAKVLTLA
jgi:hypothetical protein